jgi:copper(I)-binding protein
VPLNRLRLSAAVLLLGSAIAAAAEPPKIKVQQAWVRPTTMPMTAAYMILVASADAPARLIAVSSPVGRAELHVTQHEGAIVRMRPLPELAIAPGQAARLEPGGAHIMLLDLSRPLRQGEVIQLTLTFADAGEVTVDVPVRAQPP